ncbi:Ribosomal large subunit pseudouridine synthase D [Candidatus Profftia lariciata]|uniref:23S rRNA pseudouridine(1911/1915/1917) synthase RluD n=1 Tax=Candidatus Profftia lariciata TaxID=1987921 RepID=UPI001D02B66B|nr:23S rRNA pseudouridine(1911/1915/1917) synthase RluD [Candidatus Profftia lariciata]UDG81269.1 Ribosomal large subunit pseudouridine synthase D [Candidatus Profftia lariciata]
MTQEIKLTATIIESQLGYRLDQSLAQLFPDYSRSCIKKWILDERVQINGKIIKKPKEKVLGGQKIIINALIEEKTWKPQNIPLNIIYEDNDIVVIYKPHNLVVHPGAGHKNDTMLNALLYHYPYSVHLPRAGIVHRLDKNTTGLMVVAKNLIAQTNLIQALQRCKITREYEAIAMGIMTTGSKTIKDPIARHPIKRTHMTVSHLGKPAITHYRIMEKFRMHTRLCLRLETGRTHQIRVHMAHIGYPLVGDNIYIGRPRPPKGASKELLYVLNNFDRQALHATMLRLYHPISGVHMEWHAPLPRDMIELINVLRTDINYIKNI